MSKIKWMFSIFATMCLVYTIYIYVNYSRDLWWILMIPFTLNISVVYCIGDNVDNRKKSIGKATIFLFLIFYGIMIIIYCGGAEDNINDVDYIVVLGSGFKGNNLSVNAEYRAIEAVNLARQYEDAKIVVSGGLEQNGYFEADLLEKYILEKGIPVSRIVKENQSKDTFQNIKNVYDIIGDRKIVIVTNRFHLMRAKMIAHEVGFMSVEGKVADTDLSTVFFNYIREIGALIRETLRIIYLGV